MAQMKADSRVTAYQAAARIYCAKIGANPDETINLPHPQLANIGISVPFWYTIAERMFDLHLLLSSVSEAQKQQAVQELVKTPGAPPYAKVDHL